MSERVIGKCECGHEYHFKGIPIPPDGTPVMAVHTFMSTLYVRPVTTDRGTFHVCRRCEETCLAAYILKPERAE